MKPKEVIKVFSFSPFFCPLHCAFQCLL